MISQAKLRLLLLLIAVENLPWAESDLSLKKEDSRANRHQIPGLIPRPSQGPPLCPEPQRADCALFPDPWKGCDAPAGLPQEVSHLQLTELGSSLARFGVELYRAVADVNPGLNIALSPISVAAALTHLLLGSRNETWKDIEDALHYTGRFPCVHQILSALLNRSSTMTSASQLFYREGLCLEGNFNRRSIRFYGQRAKALTANATENIQAVNDWVSDHTAGLIPKLVDSIPDDVIIIILNAVHYAGKWKTKFDKQLTKEDDFWVSAKETVSVPVMQSVSYPLSVVYSSALKSEVAKFQLFGKNSFIVIVPQENDQTLRDLERSLKAQDLKQVVDKLYETNLLPTNVRLPRLKMDFTQELIQPLTEIGLSNALFHPNLCGLTIGADMSITSATHRAVISLDEDGVEAAAATSLSVGRTITVFDATRPFLWLLWDDVLGYPVFMGRVLNPLI